jgi:hypothetical protein
MLAGRRTIGLFKFLKNGLAPLEWNAGASIRDRKSQFRVIEHVYTQADAAALGKFDGVASQVNKDLPQTA